MSLHTPGPWEAKLDAGNDEHDISAPTWLSLAVVYSNEDRMPYLVEQSKANARLIAAAPELLEALNDACLTIAQHGDQPPAKWLAALKKARGE